MSGSVFLILLGIGLIVAHRGLAWGMGGLYSGNEDPPEHVMKRMRQFYIGLGVAAIIAGVTSWILAG